MTRKHYRTAAKIVAGFSNDSKVAWTTREAFVVFFAGDNPRFDADRFRDSCGSLAKQWKPSDVDM